MYGCNVSYPQAIDKDKDIAKSLTDIKIELDSLHKRINNIETLIVFYLKIGLSE